jgi:hypothetical protein
VRPAEGRKNRRRHGSATICDADLLLRLPGDAPRPCFGLGGGGATASRAPGRGVKPCCTTTSKTSSGGTGDPERRARSSPAESKEAPRKFQKFPASDDPRRTAGAPHRPLPTTASPREPARVGLASLRCRAVLPPPLPPVHGLVLGYAYFARADAPWPLRSGDRSAERTTSASREPSVCRTRCSSAPTGAGV